LKGSDPSGGEFQKDAELDKPGIVGARWWNRSLVDEDRGVRRRQFLVGLTVAGGAVAAASALGVGFFSLVRGESTSLSLRNALAMQRQFGWDFGARGVALVFDGQAEGPFVRGDLVSMASVMSPLLRGPNAKFYVGTLVESLFASPLAALPDPRDGRPAPDAAPFRRVADVLMPVITPAMRRAYEVGEALARLASSHADLAVLADLAGPEAVALAAGAATVFEPVLLLDNWPHPHGVVPSHLTLAALAYYQPRFASQKRDALRPPLFVLDQARLSSYSEQSDRFDNRYYARVPPLAALAKDGIRELLYVVPTPSSLPEPSDLKGVLSQERGAAGVHVQALSLTDFAADPTSGDSGRLLYGGSRRMDGAFWEDYGFGAKPVGAPRPGSPTTYGYRFVPVPQGPSPSLGTVGQVAVVVAASGLILSAALDRRGSMNRFAGGWYG
jgi:hypothetical protein